jgi:2-keto-3-deoxy-6-phosphogluconate aldolase
MSAGATDTRGVFAAYRAVHEQGFVPIFTATDDDSKQLLEAVVAAGCRVVEYTLRRRDAAEMIPWVRKNYPDLFLLVGSTVDDDRIVAKQKRRHPQLRTLDELAAMDVHGFVSMLGWTPENITRFAPTHLVLPTATTVVEAYHTVCAGAHFAKLPGPDAEIVRVCRAAPTFGFCPIFVTGGMTTERIPDVVAAGAVLIGTGIDLMFKGVAPAQWRDATRRFLDVTRESRAKTFPELARAAGSDRDRWLDALPHYHPF